MESSCCSPSRKKKKGKDCYVRWARAHSHRKVGSRLQTAGPLLSPPAVASSRSQVTRRCQNHASSQSRPEEPKCLPDVHEQLQAPLRVSGGLPPGECSGLLTVCAGHPVLGPSSRAGGHLRGWGPHAPSPSPPGIAPAAAISASGSSLSPACSPGSLNFVVNKICCFCVSMFMVGH